jgi:hypothetical protein
MTVDATPRASAQNHSIKDSWKAAAIGGGTMFALSAVPQIGLGATLGLPRSAMVASTIKAGTQALPYAAAAAVIHYSTNDGTPDSFKKDFTIGAITGIVGAAFLGHTAFAAPGAPIGGRLMRGAIVGGAFGGVVHFFDRGSKS